MKTLEITYKVTIKDDAEAWRIFQELQTEMRTGKFDWMFEKRLFPTTIESLQLTKSNGNYSKVFKDNQIMRMQEVKDV